MTASIWNPAGPPAPPTATTSDLVTFTQSGTGAVTTNVQEVLRSFIVLKEFGAVGDGTTNDTSAIVNAVAAARSAGKAILWEDKTYLTTANIPFLHTVKHIGTGRILRGTNTFHVNPVALDNNVLYVATTGSNSNDGLASTQPLLTPTAAVDVLANYGPILDGGWTIQLAAGTYPGGILPQRGLTTRDFLRIVGPSVGGHPNVPTAIISYTADPTETYGIFARDGLLLWVEDVKFTGAFPQAEYIARDCYYQRRNVHVDAAVIGLQINVHSRYYVYGGIIENCSSIGISELFHVTRSFETVASAADQLIIRNCPIGLKAKENCVGHLDYINFEDCDTGLEMQLYSGGNVSGTVFKRCGVGIVLVNSEIHGETSTAWGTGADACTRRLLSLGNSSEIVTFGWTAPGPNPAIRTGHRPLLPIANDFNPVTHTGTTVETIIFAFSALLPVDYFCVKGKKLRVVVNGKVPTSVTLADTVRITFRVAAIYATDVTIPAGIVGAKSFRAEFELICTADGNNQLSSATLVGAGFYDATSAARTIILDSTASSVRVSIELADAADSITLDSVEVYG